MTHKMLIDANALIAILEKIADEDGTKYFHLDEITQEIFDAPTVKAVPLGAYEQVKWERDQAMEQLAEHGISFGAKEPDVIKVVRCKDCKHYVKDSFFCRMNCIDIHEHSVWYGDNFCSYGERKDNERKADCFDGTCPGAELCVTGDGKANGLKKWLKQPCEVE